MGYYIINGELYHHGVKGMKWGVRRYQNKDGSLTAQGRKRHSDDGELSKFGRAILRSKVANAMVSDRELQIEQQRLVGAKGRLAETYAKYLANKRDKFQEIIKKSMSSLSPEDIQRAKKNVDDVFRTRGLYEIAMINAIYRSSHHR